MIRDENRGIEQTWIEIPPIPHQVGRRPCGDHHSAQGGDSTSTHHPDALSRSKTGINPRLSKIFYRLTSTPPRLHFSHKPRRSLVSFFPCSLRDISVPLPIQLVVLWGEDSYSSLVAEEKGRAGGWGRGLSSSRRIHPFGDAKLIRWVSVYLDCLYALCRDMFVHILCSKLNLITLMFVSVSSQHYQAASIFIPPEEINFPLPGLYHGIVILLILEGLP